MIAEGLSPCRTKKGCGRGLLLSGGIGAARRQGNQKSGMYVVEELDTHKRGPYNNTVFYFVEDEKALVEAMFEV